MSQRPPAIRPTDALPVTARRFGRACALVRYAAIAVGFAVVFVLLRALVSSQSASPIQTVFVIVLENYDWSQIAGSSAAPYINSLLPHSSYALRYYTPPGLHPSTPNYFWMEAGQDFGLAGLSNYTPAKFPLDSTAHLVTQLRNAGISWKTYQEDIDGTVCPLTSVNLYRVNHDPFVFFNDVTNNQDPNSAYCISHVRPYRELIDDLAQNTVARYNFIVPNACNDMHDCGIAAGDTWLANNLPAILNSQAYLSGGAVFITWDEGTGSTSDGPIGMIVMSPAAKGNGYSNSIYYTHSSLLLTLQEVLGVQPLLGDAPNATDLSDLFASFPAVTPSAPTPADASSGVSLGVTLRWSSSGGNDSVHLGTSNQPPLVASNIATRSYTPALLANTTYYWQIVSTTSAGTTSGPIWQFTTGATSVPSPSANQDIGVVGIAGSSSYVDGTFTIKGAGADIWGAADAFQYAYQSLTGDGQIVARVRSLQNTNSYAKAGVMMRGTLSAGSDHVILDVRPGGAVEFMQRATPGGTTTYLGGTTLAFPGWLRLARSGNTVTAATSRDGGTWTTIGSTSTKLPATVYVGLPVCSHTTSALTTAIFDSVAITAGALPPSAPASPNPASGATGVSTTPTLTWSAIGATSYDVEFGTANPPPPAATGLTTASYTPPPLAYATTYFWQVTARNSSGTTTGPVWSFTTAGAPPPSSPLPAGWSNRDIGSTGIAGSASYSSGVFTVNGAGADIWGTSDSFQYVYQPLSGDGQIVARVTREGNTSTYAKAGVMVRESLTSSARDVILDRNPSGNIEFMARSAPGGSTAWLAGASQAIPAWLKLVRSGDGVTGYVSGDGSSWTKVGSTTVSSLASSLYVGLAVCSHTTSALNTSTFDNVGVTGGSTSPPPPSATNVVIYASDIPAASVHGIWKFATDAASPYSTSLITSDTGFAQTASALSSPANYVDVTFNADAATPYTIWLRLQALGNSKYNDSVWVQFSDAQANGSQVYAMNTTTGLLVNLATDSTGSSLNGWGWQNKAYWLSQPTTVTFTTTGQHTMRIQVREDGVQFDQIVLSPTTYLTAAPGPVGGDSTIVPK